jgi:biopolymer transport protein ExbB/TolQ
MYLKEVSEKSETRFKEDREDELRGAFQLYANSLERGMAFLSGIGNLAPIVGFLGTVLGMITAFSAIAAATTVNARVVAVGIQIALITTAGGLVVAAPTLFFYYLFTHVTQNRFALSEEIIAELCVNLPRLSEELETEGYTEEL